MLQPGYGGKARHYKYGTGGKETRRQQPLVLQKQKTPTTSLTPKLKIPCANSPITKEPEK